MKLCSYVYICVAWWMAMTKYVAIYSAFIIKMKSLITQLCSHRFDLPSAWFLPIDLL